MLSDAKLEVLTTLQEIPFLRFSRIMILIENALSGG